MAQWYYTQKGQQAGPVDEAQLRGLLAGGQVGPQDLVWKDGLANWQPASSVPELATAASAPQPQQQYSSQPQSYGGAQGQPYAAPLDYGGYRQQQNYAPGSVPNYLVQSILMTIFCCWPLGIPAIIFASQVNSKLALGDYAGAVDSSKKAKMFCWIGFGSIAAVILIYVVFAVIAGIFSALN
jgi:hypothetical protein